MEKRQRRILFPALSDLSAFALSTESLSVSRSRPPQPRQERSYRVSEESGSVRLDAGHARNSPGPRQAHA